MRTIGTVLVCTLLAGCATEVGLGESEGAGGASAARVADTAGGTMALDGAGRPFVIGLAHLPFDQTANGVVQTVVTDVRSGQAASLGHDAGGGDPVTAIASAIANGDGIDVVWPAGQAAPAGLFLARVAHRADGPPEVRGASQVRWTEQPADPHDWQAFAAHTPVLASGPDDLEAVVYRLDVRQQTACYGPACEPATPGDFVRVVVRFLTATGSTYPRAGEDPIRIVDEPAGTLGCDLDAAFASDGTLHVVAACHHSLSSPADVLYHATVSPAGDHSPVDTVVAGRFLANPKLVATDDGRVDLVWAEWIDQPRVDAAACGPGAGAIWLTELVGPRRGQPPVRALALQAPQLATRVTAATDRSGRLVIAAGVSIPRVLEPSGELHDGCVPDGPPAPGAPMNLGVNRIVITATSDGQQFDAAQLLGFANQPGLTGESDPRALSLDPASGELVLAFSTDTFDPRTTTHLGEVESATWLTRLP